MSNFPLPESTLTALNPFSAPIPVAENPFVAPVPVAENPFSAPVPDIASNTGGSSWFGDLVQRGVEEGIKKSVQGNDSSTNDQAAPPSADYDTIESVPVDSYDFDGSEIVDADGGGIVGGIFDFLGGFFE